MCHTRLCAFLLFSSLETAAIWRIDIVLETSLFDYKLMQLLFYDTAGSDLPKLKVRVAGRSYPVRPFAATG